MTLLVGFHLKAAYQMCLTHSPRQDPGRSWTYPDTSAVFGKCGLRPIIDYIQVRREMVERYVVNRPIFRDWVGRERQWGTSHHQWWWEQPMILDAADETPGQA